MSTFSIYPGPATQLANGYASLIKKNTLRKGLFFCCLYVLDIGKKGPFWGGCQHFTKKGIFLGIFTEKGSFSGASSQRF